MSNKAKEKNRNRVNSYEYNSLREELISRNTNINSQVSTAVITIISAWAAGFTFRMSIINNIDKINDLNELINIKFLSAMVFLIPIFFFLPMAVKSGENLIQIASISTYIRIFYEYPKDENGLKWNWESANNLLSNANVDRKRDSIIMKLFNAEYTILGWCSYLIFVNFSIIDLGNIYKTNVNIKICALYTFFAILLSLVAIVFLILIYKSSCIKNTLMKTTEIYIERYIKIAYERGVIDASNINDVKDKMNPTKSVN